MHGRPMDAKHFGPGMSRPVSRPAEARTREQSPAAWTADRGLRTVDCGPRGRRQGRGERERRECRGLPLVSGELGYGLPLSDGQPLANALIKQAPTRAHASRVVVACFSRQDASVSPVLHFPPFPHPPQPVALRAAGHRSTRTCATSVLQSLITPNQSAMTHLAAH